MPGRCPPPSSGRCRRLSHQQVLVAFSGLLLGMLLAALDQTIVATALPTIVGELGGLEHLSWVVTAYLLASTASTPLWGKLGDLYGRKRVFQIAIVIFLVGSALCGLSQNMGQLIASGHAGTRRRRSDGYRAGSSATSSRPASAAATRASSARCSASPACRPAARRVLRGPLSGAGCST